MRAVHRLHWPTTQNKDVDVLRLTLPCHTLFMDREGCRVNAHHQRAGSSGASRVKEASESCFAAEQEGHRRAGHRGDRSHKQLVGRRGCINSGFLTKRTSLSPFTKDFRGGERSRVQSIFGGLCCLAEPKQILFKNKKSTVIYIYTRMCTHANNKGP